MVKKILKKTINKLVKSLGYEIHAYHPTTSSTARMELFLQSFDFDLVVDVGADVGQYGDLLREHGYRNEIISIEPVPKSHDKLVQRAERDPKWTIKERAALGKRNSRSEINVASSTARSTLKSISRDERVDNDYPEFDRTQSVQVHRLDDFIDPELGKDQTTLIKIDVQGAEWDILEGASRWLEQANALQLELSLISIFEENKNYLKILSFCEEKGYHLFNMIPGRSNESDGRLIQLDALMVRETEFDE